MQISAPANPIEDAIVNAGNSGLTVDDLITEFGGADFAALIRDAINRGNLASRIEQRQRVFFVLDS